MKKSVPLLLLFFTACFAVTAQNFKITGNSSGYTYANGLLTINSVGSYTVSMFPGVAKTTDDRIVVNATGGTAADTVFVTLNGVNIDFMWQYYGAAFDITGNVHVKIILPDGTDNSLQGACDCAGLQKSNAASCNLTIAGGTLNSGKLAAYGGLDGAGIGGSFEKKAENITITGGSVTATGTGGGAGIGGGYNGYGDNIVITGGSVTATGAGGGAGIGGGDFAYGDNIVITGGSVKAVAGGGVNAVGGGLGEMSGRATNGEAVPEDVVCYIYTFTGLAGKAVTNITGIPAYYGQKDMVTDSEGKLYLWLPAAVQPDITAVCDGKKFSGRSTMSIITDLQVETLINNGYTYANGLLTISSVGSYTVSMFPGVATTTDRIVVNATGGTAADTVFVTLNGVNIDCSSVNNAAAFDITGNVHVKIVLPDGTDNSLKSGSSCAGLQKSNSALNNLSIRGNGSLTAIAGKQGAGIGGGKSKDGKNITITGGTITATGVYHAAGIGGGDYGSASDITITGGRVTATGSYGGAGIGAGNMKTASGITISGGTVTATGGYFESNIAGAGIGAGNNSSATAIVISGGSVKATARNAAQAVGSGNQVACIPTNGEGKDVHCHTYTFVGKPNTHITSFGSSPLPAYYGTKDIYTDESGIAYLWLPENYKNYISGSTYTMQERMGTLCYPAEVLLENGIRAFTAISVNAASTHRIITFEEIATSNIPAGSAVLLYGEAGRTLTLPESYYTSDAAATEEGNLLRGTYRNILAPVGSYVLQNQSDKVAFFRVETGLQPYQYAFRCRLEWNGGGNGIQELRLDESLLTGIEQMYEERAGNDAVVYDLNGRRVLYPKRGEVYVVDGKKMLVK